MEDKDIVERIVDWVIQSQENAQSRFGGFHYGDNYVIRDHIKERKEQKAVEVFRAPYDLVDHEDVMRRVQRKFVIDDLRQLLEDRPQQVMKFAAENMRT